MSERLCTLLLPFRLDFPTHHTNLDFRSPNKNQYMMMDSRKLATLLSSLISQLILLLLLIFPSTSNSTDSNFNPNLNSTNCNSFIHQFLLSHQIAATLSRKRKRKRSHPESYNPDPLIRSPDDFRNSFNMTSSTFEWLAGLLEPLLDCRDPADLFPLNLTAGTRLGIGLFRLATGSDYPDISTRFGVSVSVARFCVKHLCRVLCTNFRFWVSFPNPNELESVSRGFQGLSGLPHCCGAVQCIRFEVLGDETTPSTVVSAQIVVDSSWRVMSIVAGFLGHKSNSMILKATTLYLDIEGGKLLNAPNSVKKANGVSVNQYLVGDEGHPLLPWLMVPFGDTVTGSSSVEENFNAALEAMRRPAIRTAASLRNWGVLRKPIREEVKVAVAYIGACSILHNGLLMREDFSTLIGGVEEYVLQQQKYRECCSLEEDDSATEKGLVMRSTLATMAKKIQDSN